MITYTAHTTVIADRSQHGLCPCCGGPLADATSISRGVGICGTCAGFGHCIRPGPEAELGRAVVSAIIDRNDGPVARLLPGSWLPCSRRA